MLSKMTKKELLDYIHKMEKEYDEIISNKNKVIKLYQRKDLLVSMFVNNKVRAEDVDEEIMAIKKELEE